MAIQNGIPVGVFSMEMSYQEVVNRLFCSETNVSLQRFRDGFLTDFLSNNYFKELEERSRNIGKAPIWIDDSPALSIASFKARSRLMRTRFGVQAIVVDYLHLMRSPTKQEARWLEITEISASMKIVAKELGIPVICCAQLNREAESREFGKPKLSDLRESGSIEQDADIVILLWRPERHIQHPKNEDNKSEKNKLAKLLGLKDGSGDRLWRPEKKSEEDPLTREQIKERTRQIDEYAELHLAKQRNGPVGEIRLRFLPEITRFEGINVNEKDYSNNPREQQEIEEPF
jgi:replicative DNA helicase